MHVAMYAKFCGCCRAWQASSEQLQWQVSDLQRKLTDAEQRSTVWARRAGAAEARLPIHAISANTRLKLPEQRVGLYGTASLSPTAAAGLHATASGLYDAAPGLHAAAPGAEGLHGPASGLHQTASVSPSAAAAEINRSGSVGYAISSGQGGLSHALSGMDTDPVQGAETRLQQEHEDGCALAMLQEAFSVPFDAPEGFASQQSWTHAEMMGHQASIRGVHDSTYTAAQTAKADVLTGLEDSPNSLQGRIAAMHDQNAKIGRPSLQLKVFNDQVTGVASSAPDSPLKQRIAEYNSMILQQCSSPRIAALTLPTATSKF